MEENQELKTIRKAAAELKLPLWRDNLDDYISRFVAEAWSVRLRSQDDAGRYRSTRCRWSARCRTERRSCPRGHGFREK